MRDTPPDRLLVGLRSGASYAKGVWLRLNGNPTEPGEASSAVLSLLPRPSKPDREQRASSIAVLSQSIDALEKRLQDTSKVCKCTCPTIDRNKGGYCMAYAVHHEYQEAPIKMSLASCGCLAALHQARFLRLGAVLGNAVLGRAQQAAAGCL